MTSEESLARFGIVPRSSDVPTLRRELRAEMQRCREGAVDDLELLRTLCVQLFAAGDPQDCLIIAEAKLIDMDTDGVIDVELLCGAGLPDTKEYLRTLATPEGDALLELLRAEEAAGYFNNFSPSTYLDQCREYYGVAK